MSLPVLAAQQFVLSLEGLLHGICLNLMLTPKNPRQPFWLRTAWFYGAFLCIMSISWIFGRRIPGFINLICVFTVFQILMKHLFQEKLQTRLMAYLLLYVMLSLADIALCWFYFMVLQRGSLDYMENEMLVQLCFGMGLAALLDWFACTLWIRKRSLRNSGAAMAGAALAAVFMYAIFFAGGVFISQAEFRSEVLWGALLSFGGTGSAIVICLLYQRRQGKRNRVEWENLSRILAQQESFFRTLEEQEKKASFIRHDHLNVFGTVSQLLRQQQEKDALLLLSDYQQRLYGTGLQQMK